MAERKSAKKTAPKATRRAAAKPDAAGGFTEEERAAMRERARELKSARRSRSGDAGAESEESTVLAKLAAMAPSDRAIGERIHAIIRASAPALAPRLWYGMPAYTTNGTVLCFFQDARKFKARYATLGFTGAATLDEGDMWPTSFALTKLTPAVEARIEALVKRAVGG